MTNPNLYKSGKGLEIQQVTWKLMAGIPDYHPACAKVLEGLIEGLAAGCGRGIAVKMTSILAARRRSSGRSIRAYVRGLE